MERIRAILQMILRMIDAALGHQREGPARAALLKQREIVGGELAALDQERDELARIETENQENA